MNDNVRKEISLIAILGKLKNMQQGVIAFNSKAKELVCLCLYND